MLKDRKVLERLMYLDADFISSAYEEIRNVSPTTQFTKVEGMGAQGGFPFLKADLHSQESKTFTLSSVQMLKAINDDLETLFRSLSHPHSKTNTARVLLGLAGVFPAADGLAANRRKTRPTICSN